MEQETMGAPAAARASQETFSATLTRLKEQQASKVDVVVNTKAHLQMVVPVSDGIVQQPRIVFADEVGKLPGANRLIGQEFNVTDHAHSQIAARAGVHLANYRRFRDDHPDVLAYMMNALWQREPEPRMVRTFVNGDNLLRGWVSHSYRVVDNLPFLTAALEEAEKHGCTVHTANVDDTRMYVKLPSPRVAAIKLGDPIQAGVLIRNSEVGDGKIEVSPYILRQSCWNGAVSTKNYSRIHLGSVQEDGVQSQATQLKESDYIFSAIKDWLRFCLAPANLEEVAAQFQRAEEVRVEVAAKLAVANVVRFGGLTKGEGDGVLERYLRADNDTQFTLLNAVTEQAHMGRSTYRRQVEMEELGGKLLEMTEDKFTKLVSHPLTDKELAGAYSAN